MLGALEQCAAVGVKNAVIISSGFAEEGGDSTAMQDAIVALAKKTGMRISGPNAEGFYSEAQHVAATFSPTVDVKPGAVDLVATRRRAAIVAQSGGIGFAIKHRAKALGIAISYCVSAGNECDLGAGEFLDYMVQDSSTDVILLFIEGIRDVDKFLAAAQRAAEIGKPIIVTKVGRSGAGERAAASHTASMAGWSAAYDAVFAKYGFIVSNDLDEAVAIAAVLTTSPLPKGDRVARRHGLRRRRHLGRGYGFDAGLAGAGIARADAGGNQKTAAVLWRGAQPDRRHRAGREQRRSAEEHRTARRLRRNRRHPGGAVAVERHADAVQARRAEAGDRRAEQADRVLLLYAAVEFRPHRACGIRRRRALGPDPCRRCDAPDRRLCEVQAGAAGWTLPRSAPRDISAYLKSATLSEHDSKSLLRDAGIALPDEMLVTEKSALDAAIARVGFPLVMKIQSRDIPHKSEVGGVRVNIATKGEAFAAYDALLESARQHRPDAGIQGVLVSPMAKKGVEIIVGTMLDATFGPMIMVGLGGITTELFKDVIYRPAPVSAEEASAMLGELKAAPLLNGFRGAAKADVPALAQLISQISQLAARYRDEISEIEINPVLVHPEGKGVTIVDALVVPKTGKVALPSTPPSSRGARAQRDPRSDGR